jgi:hypothetical protein
MIVAAAQAAAMDFDDADMILIPIRRPNRFADSEHRLPPRCGGPIECPAIGRERCGALASGFID